MTETAPGRVGEERAVRLHGDVRLLLADGRRVGWIAPAAGGDEVSGYDVHGLVPRPDGRPAATVPYREVPSAVRAAAAALGMPGAEDADVVSGPLIDHRGRAVETAPADLAGWRLVRGRVPGREDVVVRGRVVGWLQPDSRGGYVPCTLDGPVAVPAATREDAAVALFAALYAPAPLPELPPEARTRRRPQARPRTERPLCPYSQTQLAAAAIDPPSAEGGGYEIAVDGLRRARGARADVSVRAALAGRRPRRSGPGPPRRHPRRGDRPVPWGRRGRCGATPTRPSATIWNVATWVRRAGRRSTGSCWWSPTDHS
ncbi:hypothetical protein [Actinomadura sp. WAC 06369]|uniref:hypothetical protein n=1 Tax=Actinomadura sp. WAC 06369 TaxID=2203193 RepID=UPI000F7973DA|nr:hypothetical protein [Actinomadura sp. WAC 06369]